MVSGRVEGVGGRCIFLGQHGRRCTGPTREHPAVTPRDLDELQPAPAASTQSRLQLLGRRKVWALVGPRMLSDPVWYFYLFWLPDHLQLARGMTLGEIGIYGWLPFFANAVTNVMHQHKPWPYSFSQYVPGQYEQTMGESRFTRCARNDNQKSKDKKCRHASARRHFLSSYPYKITPG